MLIHKIDTGDIKPISQTLGQRPPANREKAVRIFNGMQQAGVNESSNSPWALSVFLFKEE